MRADNRAGAALLEVMVALTILMASGVAAVGAARLAQDAQHLALTREAELMDAERLLSALSLLDRADLDRRLGGRQIGPWHVEVLRPERTVYRVSVGRTGDPGHTLLVTLLFRPERTGP